MVGCLSKLVLALALILAPGVVQAQIEGSITLDNSLNNNTIYIGDMSNAWQSSHQFEHQFDHQMAFGAAFQSSTGSNFYLPVSNSNLEQANTGISVGDYAGSAAGANLMNMGNAQVAGMFALNANVAAVGTNQAVLNAVVAFAAPAP